MKLMAGATPLTIGDQPKMGREHVPGSWVHTQQGRVRTRSFWTDTPGKGQAQLLSLDGKWTTRPVEYRGQLLSVGGKPLDGGLSNMAMASVLARMGRADITVHGFRSTFRDWAAERTNYPNHVVEMALAHVVGDKVEAAYRRGDLFAKRVRLMADWAKFCTSKPAATDAKVVSIRGSRRD